MNEHVVNTQELLSALVDGELSGVELEQALAQAEDATGQGNWQLYHLVGDVLRSPDLAHHSQHDLLSGLRAQLAQEPPLQLASAGLTAVAATHPVAVQPAANAAVFRWKMAAGFASVAAVVAVGWQVLALQPSGPTGAQIAQMAQLPSNAPVVAVASQDGKNVMLRDPNLDALLAVHQQYANRPSLQVPADFLRNASLSHTNGQ